MNQPSSETLRDNNTCQIIRLPWKKQYLHLWAAWLSQLLFLSQKLAWEPQWTNVIYTDFEKAFDQVSSRRLLYKWSQYGIWGKVLCWLSTCLIGREQRVVLEGIPSSWCAVTSGVPQGKILGLMMLLFFVNNIPKVVSGQQLVTMLPSNLLWILSNFFWNFFSVVLTKVLFWIFEILSFWFFRHFVLFR